MRLGYGWERALTDAVAFAGHRVHLCRPREAGTLLRWLGTDLSGKRILDVAGGDGYWAGRCRARGAEAVCLDLSRRKLRYGRTLSGAPALVAGDALRLPFPEGSFDAVMSVCAIEHFADGARALDEMARVLRPGGDLVLSADALTRSQEWPHLDRAHRRRYAVQRTYTHTTLDRLFRDCGIEVQECTYHFRTRGAEKLYVGLSAYGGRMGPNVAAIAAPLVALTDRFAADSRGSLVLVRGKRTPGASQ